jgi:hypothetical protein
VSRLSFHEAGHALAAIALGKRIEAVSVDPVAHASGLCELADAFPDEPTAPQIEDALVILLAGQIAETYA